MGPHVLFMPEISETCGLPYNCGVHIGVQCEAIVSKQHENHLMIARLSTVVASALCKHVRAQAFS